MILARMSDYGFLVPSEPAGPERTPDGKFRLLQLPGVEQSVQYFQVSLEASAPAQITDHEVIVVAAHYPLLGDESIQSLAAALASHAPAWLRVFFLADATGSASVTCNGEVPRELAAAAVATIKVVAGWEESLPIVVDVDGHVLDVDVTRSGGQWLVRATPHKR